MTNNNRITFRLAERSSDSRVRLNFNTTDTLGPCGCTDYHMSDCPTRTGGSVIFTGDDQDDWYRDDYYYSADDPYWSGSRSDW